MSTDPKTKRLILKMGEERSIREYSDENKRNPKRPRTDEKEKSQNPPKKRVTNRDINDKIEESHKKIANTMISYLDECVSKLVTKKKKSSEKKTKELKKISHLLLMIQKQQNQLKNCCGEHEEEFCVPKYNYIGEDSSQCSKNPSKETKISSTPAVKFENKIGHEFIVKESSHEEIEQNYKLNINSPSKLKIVEIKSEHVDAEEVITKIVDVFPTPIVKPSKFRPPLSEERLKFSEKIKSEPQPCCSKNIPIQHVKQEPSQAINISPLSIKPEPIPGIDISDEFKSLSENMIAINRWMATEKINHGFKDNKALEKMLTKNSLMSLFKCMGAKCCYTTINDDNFLEHLNVHQESNYFIKDYYLNCPYCFFKSTGPIDLVEHYKTFHNNCIYQCSMCFYRSAEMQSVYDHQIDHHKIDSRRTEVLECPQVFPMSEASEEKRANMIIKQAIKYLICDVCNKRFVSPDECLKHLSDSHKQGEELEKAKIQTDEINIEMMNLKIGKYQCLECGNKGKPYGTINKIEMRTHLLGHPKRFHYVCVREISELKLFRINPRKDIRITKFNGDLTELQNKENIMGTSMDQFL